MKSRISAVMILAGSLVLGACSSGYTQEELDAAVAEAVEESLESQEDETATTTTRPTTTTTTRPATTTTTRPATTTTTRPTTTTTLNFDNFSEISDRDYELMTRQSDCLGESYVIYGHVTQFDSGTGPDGFRANTAGTEQADWFDYDINTILTGSAEMFSNVVTDDLVKMWVLCMGPFEYETTLGATLTVPWFEVMQIEVIGTSD